MKKIKVTKKIPFLDFACKEGERVQWKNFKGEKFEGIIIKMNEDCLATIQLDNKNIVEVQC